MSMITVFSVQLDYAHSTARSVNYHKSDATLGLRE